MKRKGTITLDESSWEFLRTIVYKQNLRSVSSAIQIAVNEFITEYGNLPGELTDEEYLEQRRISEDYRAGL